VTKSIIYLLFQKKKKKKKETEQEATKMMDTTWVFYLLEVLLLAYVLKVCYNFRSAGMHMTRPGDEAERTEEEDSLLDDSQSEPEDESNSEKEQ
jgi:hypothetical protein